jgi:hypothetical protein
MRLIDFGAIVVGVEMVLVVFEACVAFDGGVGDGTGSLIALNSNWCGYAANGIGALLCSCKS